MHHNHLQKLLIWTGLIIAPFLAFLLWDEVENLIENFKSEKEAAKQVVNLTPTQEPLYVEDVNRPKHIMPRVYPYSVVAGGVHSVQELQLAMWRDPVVANHYSNFKLGRVRVIEAKADRNFHVSYRIGEEIFWTKNRLKVAKGERLITDGINFARTRCANVLSEVPRGKTRPDEPPPEVLDAPLNPPPYELIDHTPPPSGSTPFTPPIVIEGGLPPTTPPPSGSTPFTPPIVVGGGLPPTTSPPSGSTPFTPPIVVGGGLPAPAPVPEPATMLLLGSGLVGLWAAKRNLKK